MREFFRQAPIRQKMTAIVMLVSTAVLVLMLVAFILTEIVSYRQTLVDKTFSLAEILGRNTQNAIAFRDPLAAERILSSLRAEDSIEAAYVFDPSGKPFAYYLHPVRSLRGGDSSRLAIDGEVLRQVVGEGRPFHRFTLNALVLLQPIEMDGHRIGTVFVQSDLRPLYERLQWFAVAAMLVFGCSILLAYLLSSRLQEFISRPLVDLVEMMSTVSREQNFSLRASAQTQDEIGRLIAGFNEMLSHIEERDRELDRHRRHLEDLIAQRTMELRTTNEDLGRTVEDLERAKAAAEEASRTKSQFLANMSHEIRTPMIGVLGMAELLSRTPLDERQRSLVTTVYNSGEALLSILNDILDFSKIEAGRLELEKVPFDFRLCVEDAVDLLAERAFAKGLELVCIMDDKLPFQLLGDPGRLRQIVLNLLGNAVKFTHSGEVVVQVKCLMEERQSLWFRLEVRDTGIGIAPEVRAQIFESFRQADNSTSREFGGTGLGLTIVRQLVEMMGGQVGLESQPGQGSIFWVHLRMEKQTAAASLGAPLPRELVGQKALVVDDNEAVRFFLADALTHLGLRPRMAASLEEAASLLGEAAFNGRPFAVALVDADLEKSDDGNAAQILAARPEAVQTRVVMMCPQAQCASAAERSDAEISGCLIKPVRSSLLPGLLAGICAADPPALGRSPAIADPATSLMSDRNVRRILVAEDNPTTQRLIELLFEGMDHYHVCIVGSGDKVLESLAGQPPDDAVDLVFMDCQLPGLDGFETTRILRERGFRMPIVALTAHAQQEDMERCLAVGMDDFLRKPFRQQELFGVMDKWLR